MAPVRRRVSRRVVKSTFQECFEYDIPGFRSPKRPVLPVTTSRNSVSTGKIKKPSRINNSKEATTSKDVKVPSTINDDKILKTNLQQKKDKLKTVASKVKQGRTVIANEKSETINELQSSVVTRVKAKKAFMGSDYKRFKSAQSRSKLNDPSLSTKILEKETPKQEACTSSSPLTTISEESKTASSVDSVLESKNWQPVVHLEKLNVDNAESSKSSRKYRKSNIHRHAHSHASSSSELVTGTQNTCRSPLTSRNDHGSLLSSQDTANRTLGGLLKSAQSIENSSNSVSTEVAPDSASAVCRGRKSSSRGAVEGIFKHCPSVGNQTASDSAMEDWPDDSSDASDLQELKDNADRDKVPPEQDWASPHVSLIMHWQEHFNCVTNDLRNSFDHLKSIIEDKNASINTLRRKLEHYSDNSYHNSLDKILQDYDNNDANNPATVILNSILEYSNTHE